MVRFYWILARSQFVLLVALVTWLSLTPSPGETLENTWDKLLHVLGWFGLTLSLRLAWRAPRLPLLAVLSLFVYSLLVESFQAAVPERQFSGLDLLANGLGIVLAYGLARGLWPSVRHLASRLLT